MHPVQSQCLCADSQTVCCAAVTSDLRSENDVTPSDVEAACWRTSWVLLFVELRSQAIPCREQYKVFF